MAKTLRTSGNYTIKAGDGFNSGSGSNTVEIDALTVSIPGNLTVGGTSAIVNTTNTTIEDNIIELNTGATANNNSAGIIIERGSAGNNAAILWQENADKFILGLTTATAADKSSAITVTASPLEVAALTATTGTFSGAVTMVGATVNGTITAGQVTTNEIVSNGSNAQLTITSSGSGDVKLDSGGDVIIDADNADIKLEDGGTEFGRISRVTSDLVIKSMGNNNDILFKGLDDTSTITALSLDMSAAGAASFNASVTAATSFIIGSADINETDLEKIDGITNGTVAANKAVVVDANLDAASFRNITATGTITAGGITLTGSASGITVDNITLNDETISTSSNADLILAPGGTGGVIASALRFSGTTISADDSSTVNINEGLIVDGTVNSGAITSTGTINSGAITSTGSVTSGSSFIIGSADINETDLEKLDGITNGAGAANKALVLDANADVASGLRNLTTSGKVVSPTVELTNAHIESGTVTHSGSSGQQELDSFVAATFRGGVYTISISDSAEGKFETVTLSVTHDGSTSYISSSGVSSTGTSMATFSTDISDSNVRILIVPISNNSTVYKFSRTLIEV